MVKLVSFGITRSVWEYPPITPNPARDRFRLFNSCPNPHTPSIAEVVEAIQSVAVAFGSINSFHVYVDPDRHLKGPRRAASLRQQLHDAGVSRRFKVALISSDIATLGSKADDHFVWNRSPTGQVLMPFSNNHLLRIVGPASSLGPNHNFPPPYLKTRRPNIDDPTFCSSQASITDSSLIPVIDHRATNPEPWQRATQRHDPPAEQASNLLYTLCEKVPDIVQRGPSQQLHATSMRARLRHFHFHHEPGSDCPTIRGKTVADKIIIIDILAFALQNRTPKTLVVISADPDLAYGVSLLRQRRFKVILITSPSTPTDGATLLRSHSDISFTWEDALGGERTAPGDPNVPLSLGSPASRSQRSLREISEDGLTDPPSQTTDSNMHEEVTPDQETAMTPPESYEPASSSPRPYQPAASSDVPETITNPTNTSDNICVEHLCEVVDMLVKSARQRGWPLAEIQMRVASSPKMGWKKTMTIALLEEGVRLGVLEHTVKPETRTRSELHYYAVEAGLKAKWVQGVSDPVGFLRAQTNLTTDAHEDADGPLSSSMSDLNAHPKPRSRDLNVNTPNIKPAPARIDNPNVSDVPNHLRDIIEALVQAERLRGWPQESIGYHLHRRDLKRWKDPGKVLAALEESVQIGLLVTTVAISKKNKNVKTYYAVKDGLKKSWLSRFQRV
ncbi:hypothetical protein FRC01_014834 [Tulasnella sp. 417]|nr:hypothetical protein FRC01_014834 [Tulasnella sp. 417]